MPPVLLAVHRDRVLERVERDAARRVADRVHRDLQPRGIRGDDDGLQRLERPDRVGVRPVGVRMPHAAVHASITPSSTSLTPATRSHGESPCARELDRAFHLGEVRGLVAACSRRTSARRPGSGASAAALGRAPERREPELVERHVDDARDARREVGRDGALDGGVALGVGRLRGEVLPHVLLRGGLEEHAVGLAVGVAPDTSADDPGCRA